MGTGRGGQSVTAALWGQEEEPARRRAGAGGAEGGREAGEMRCVGPLGEHAFVWLEPGSLSRQAGRQREGPGWKWRQRRARWERAGAGDGARLRPGTSPQPPKKKMREAGREGEGRSHCSGDSDGARAGRPLCWEPAEGSGRRRHCGRSPRP